MLLSNFATAAVITVDRNGEFCNLGFVTERRPGMLSFLESERFLPALLQNETICAVITPPELAERIPKSMALGICGQPRIGFAVLHNQLASTGFYWTDFPTVIDRQANVHPRAWVAETNVRIGPHCHVGPNATILERCVLGANVTVGAGAVLGGVGFQTARTADMILEMFHAGGLQVADGARILQGAVIATGLFRNNTEIGCDARIGAQSFVSHGVLIGQRAFVGHGSVVNGNVVIQDDAWIGPGAVIAQNLKVGPRAFVSLGSVVIRDVEAEKQVSGNFAISHRLLLRNMAAAANAGEPG